MSRRRTLSDDDLWRDAVAYDRWFDTPWGHYSVRVETQAILRALGDIQGAVTLDVGCGTGRLTAALRIAGADAIGLDREPAMLDVAHHRIASLVVGDALAIPVRDSAVDIAVAVTVLEFVADHAAAMAELARVVRPGGRFIVGALNPHSAWGLAHRHDFSAPPWNAARFLTRQQLRDLGAPYGRLILHGALYAPGVVPFDYVIGPALEQLGRALPSWGAFQTLVVETTPTP